MYACHVRGRSAFTGDPFGKQTRHVAFGPDLYCAHCGMSDRIPDFLTSAVSRRNAFLCFYRDHRECGDPLHAAAAWNNRQWDERLIQAENALNPRNRLGADKADARQLAAWIRVPLENAIQLFAIVRPMKGKPCPT